jgi:hypothetical protein
MKKFIRFFFFLLFILLSGAVMAQPVEQNVKVIIGPDHQNWIYKVGEQVKFNVTVLQYGNLLKNVKIVYELGPEKMNPDKRDSLQLSGGMTTIEAGTMKIPGFYRCVVTAEVNGKKYSNLATVGFDPEQIKPAAVNPDDFIQFWNNAKLDLAKIPMDARILELAADYMEFYVYPKSRVNTLHCLRFPEPELDPITGMLQQLKKALLHWK